jgi:hypothetical protein
MMKKRTETRLRNSTSRIFRLRAVILMTADCANVDNEAGTGAAVKNID